MEFIPLSRFLETPLEIRRREFLKGIGAGAMALPAIAGPFVRVAAAAARTADGVDQDAVPRAGGAAINPDGLSPDHFVPLDKRLDPKWVEALFARGEPTIYSGERRAACAMPVGGIGCGQLYVGGDGTLRTWEIFNRRGFSGWGEHNYETEYETKKLARVIEHGFAVVVKRPDGTWNVKRLREEDFPDVTMKGQHPIAEFTYPASDGGADPFHVETKLEVFAPFVPGNSADSTLPATFFKVKLRATGPAAEVFLISWLENATAPDSGDRFGGGRMNQINVGSDSTEAVARVEIFGGSSAERRAPEVFADFEGDDYGAWKVEGEAFGKRPSHGTEPNQNPVSGFQGKGLVNTYRPDDRPTGRLTSPKFKIARRFINFLIGGGKTKETALRLVLDGEVVASASGQESETLAWAFFDCEKWQGREATLEIVDAASGGWGHINVDQIEFADTPRVGNGGPFETQPDVGTMHWIAFGKAVHSSHDWKNSLEAAARLQAGDVPPNAYEKLPWEAKTNHPVALLVQKVKLPFDAEQTFEFALAWHHPNAAEGNWYAARFADGAALVDYLTREAPRLTASTRAWHDAYYSGSLPHWLLERLHAPVSNLQTNVTQVWKNGRFWAWEGVGCCEGTCTHVWNYEHATGRMFPQLARTTRELQDLGAGFHEDGLVGYRGADVYAADGQCGTVLKCFREHQMSADDQFLKRNWPKIRKVVEYLLKRDGNDDGLLEDDQHNTYDIQFFGPNTFVGSLYLAALRAAEEMARLVNDGEFALRCRKVFDIGTRLTSEKLFNGEYFIQQVDLKAHPKDQYADGCLADQMFGQGWARQLGLGDLYPVEMVKKALQSVFRYCWAPDTGPQMAHHAPERYFARAGEAGLFVCTWPKSTHLGGNGIRYRDEVWTGIEYQVAGHMVWEGLVMDGLAIVRAIHERYDGRIHNPWNEVECGDHYARAMASVGVYLALLGFRFDGPAGMVGFAPRLKPEAFRAVFPSTEGFGVVHQSRTLDSQLLLVEAVQGRLKIAEIRATAPPDWLQLKVTTGLDDRRSGPAAAFRPIDSELAHLPTGELSIRLKVPVELHPRPDSGIAKDWKPASVQIVIAKSS